jgi:hypothetical protein
VMAITSAEATVRHTTIVPGLFGVLCDLQSR